MPAAERVALEAKARPIVSLFAVRSLDASATRRSAQAMTRVVIESLRRGCMPDASPAETVGLSLTQQWLMKVESVLRQVGKELGVAAPYVLMLRLSRNSKKAEGCFPRITDDINAGFERSGRGCDVITWQEAEGLYRGALVRFVALLEERSIGRELSQTSQHVTTTTETPISERSAKILARAGRRLQALARVVKREGHQREGDLVRISAEARVPAHLCRVERRRRSGTVSSA